VATKLRVVLSNPALPQLRQTRAARFYLVHDTKKGKNVPNEHNMFRMVTTYPKSHAIFQMALKYISSFQSEALKIFPKIGIFGLKTNHLATLRKTLVFG
jgi:hypothetical protein